MELISAERREQAIFEQPGLIRKLELRDHYEIDRELFEAWRTGDRDTVEKSRQDVRDDMRSLNADGFEYRRVRVVSEPLSEYQRMAVEIANPEEKLRWLPRASASGITLPANDCLIRDDVVVFNLIGGDNQSVGMQLSTDPAVVRLCLDAFEQAWALGTPNGTYAP
ncbi:DUF6879 family protein [Nocardioides sp. NPDC051685]|uniref:DUF6879 family protein n=1 Tax=Nocardioides sp. NPDC051685 TaxID=3364334 RepID=UPI0037A485AF